MSANRSHRFPLKVALPLAVLLMSGILHATPITSVGENQLRDSKQLAGRGIAPTGTNAAMQPGVGDAALSPRPSVDTSTQAATSVCIFSSDCYTTVEVPEPQSLVLVGSGLLSMAGLIRRRLLR